MDYTELSKMVQKVIPGIDIYLQTDNKNKNQRLALVTNDAALNTENILSRVAFLKKGFNLVKIFSPEHGITVKGADGVFQSNDIDTVTSLPVVSLYSNKLAPDEEDLRDIDIVLFDIPDVGCRFYTYLWTMTYVMEACAKYGKEFILLDRPNPLGGDPAMIEGPMLDEENCSSFIGRWSIPIRHCCTFGELAGFLAEKKINELDLKIVPVEGWRRDQLAGTPGFDFYPTSPAIKNIETAIVYPGMGLLEGVYINEGRGTEKPFLQFGAPWINSEELQSALEELMNFGLKTKPIEYIPLDSLYKGEKCNGLELTVTDEKTFYPVSFGINLISLLIKLYPENVKERLYHTNANPSGTGHLDKLLGIKDSFQILRSGTDIKKDIVNEWSETIQPFHLYE